MGIVFALVLLGCADDGAACERLPIEPEIYVSKAQCQARQDVALQSAAAQRADHPLVISRCLQTGAPAAMASAAAGAR